MTGIADFIAQSRSRWDLFLEEDFRSRTKNIEKWRGDGIIADFDDPDVAAALSAIDLPVVAVGGSFEDTNEYPKNLPYVATDNFKLIKCALEHLIESGLENFAFFSLPQSENKRWALERENAFRRLMDQEKVRVNIFRGSVTDAGSWNDALEQQINWIQSLPKPVGIISVTDARARQLLQACTIAEISVPDEVAIIGIDNDPLSRMLTTIPLSSVVQGAREIGWQAASILSKWLHTRETRPIRLIVPPAGINALTSSRYEAIRHPYIKRARHFIHQFVFQGIKAEQVAEYVGVSRSTLDSYFRKELGCSVHDEIFKLRLSAAKKMLAQGNQSLEIVAEKCGFTSSQYLYLVFRREQGCTPREYQRRLAEEFNTLSSKNAVLNG